jgi:hypothetical protein
VGLISSPLRVPLVLLRRPRAALQDKGLPSPCQSHYLTPRPSRPTVLCHGPPSLANPSIQTALPFPTSDLAQGVDLQGALRPEGWEGPRSDLSPSSGLLSPLPGPGRFPPVPTPAWDPLFPSWAEGQAHLSHLLQPVHLLAIALEDQIERPSLFPSSASLGGGGGEAGTELWGHVDLFIHSFAHSDLRASHCLHLQTGCSAHP